MEQLTLSLLYFKFQDVYAMPKKYVAAIIVEIAKNHVLPYPMVTNASKHVCATLVVVVIIAQIEITHACLTTNATRTA